MSKTVQSSAPTEIKPFPWVGLITLAAAVFLSVTSEMLPTGLLPDMSHDLGVTESQVGLLVTWFAFTVVITTAPMTHFTRTLPRHGLVITVLVVFAISNVLTAIAPSYEFVIASRVLGGVAHGLFWAVVGAYAGHLVPKEQIGRAVSITVAGGTLAFIFGVPLATAAGQLLGWRLAFGLLAVLMLVGAAIVWKSLPPVEHFAATQKRSRTAAQSDADASAPVDRGIWRDPTMMAVLLICSITGLTMIGHYTFYTYIAPFLLDGLGVSTSMVAPLLFVYGIAGAVGLVIAGTLFGPRPQLGLVTLISVSAVSVSVLAIFTANLPVALVAFVLWGIAFGGLPAMMQTRLLHTASPRIRDAASAFYTSAFNAGIGGGALLGATLLEVVGLDVIPFVYVGILVASLTLVVVSDLVIRRRRLA